MLKLRPLPALLFCPLLALFFALSCWRSAYQGLNLRFGVFLLRLALVYRVSVPPLLLA